MERLPHMTRTQMVTKTEALRNWKSAVEERLKKTDGTVFIVREARPEAAVLSYDRYEELWKSAQEAEDAHLMVESLLRILEMMATGQEPVPLSDVVTRLGITDADLEASPDVTIE